MLESPRSPKPSLVGALVRTVLLGWIVCIGCFAAQIALPVLGMGIDDVVLRAILRPTAVAGLVLPSLLLLLAAPGLSVFATARLAHRRNVEPGWRSVVWGAAGGALWTALIAALALGVLVLARRYAIPQVLNLRAPYGPSPNLDFFAMARDPTFGRPLLDRAMVVLRGVGHAALVGALVGGVLVPAALGAARAGRRASPWTLGFLALAGANATLRFPAGWLGSGLDPWIACGLFASVPLGLGFGLQRARSFLFGYRIGLGCVAAALLFLAAREAWPFFETVGTAAGKGARALADAALGGLFWICLFSMSSLAARAYAKRWERETGASSVAEAAGATP